MSYTVTLDLFAEAETGRQVFAPSLSLVLESGAGNGCFGGGWQVPISAVTRMVDKRLPEYNHQDAFMVKGLGELVPALRADGTPDIRRVGEHDIARYRLRFEGAFDRIELWSHRRTGEAHWIITTRGNVTHTYGATPEARIANPRDSRLVFSWLLERSEDDRGQVILYRYKAEDLDDVDSSAAEWNRLRGAQPITNRYPKHIRFGNTVPFDQEGTSCLFHVAFDYGEHDPEIPTPDEAPGRSWPARQDPIRWCRAGFEIRTFRLCRRILMFHHMAELGPGPTLVRSVDLSYDENPYLTKLASITKKGYQRAVGSSGPYSVKVASWERFQYTSDEIRTEVKTLGHNPRQLAAVLSYKHAQWIDLDGDALPGVLSNSGVALYYAKNHGRGRIDPPRALPTKPSVISGRPGPLNLMDLDADGTNQLVLFERPLAGYFTRDAKNDTWEPMVYFDSILTIDWRSPDILFLDLNGDNRVDILVPSARGYDWYPSLGRSGFGAARSFPGPSDEQQGPVIAHASQRQLILLADMTGDGLTDIVRVENGRVCYWPNMGYGRFGAMVTMDNPPRFDRDHAFDAQRIRVGDIDGSGTADLLYFGSEGLVLWRNQAGNRFGEAIKLGVYPDAMTRVDVLDVLGTGTASIVWSNASPGRERTVFIMDLMGSKKPHLLEYDRHALLITRTRDALDNERRVENDYRTLAPCLITEPNGNRIATRCDEIGVAVASAVMGKEGDTEGDTLDDPTTVVEADLLRFETTGKPGYIRMRTRERHGDPSTRWQESISYFNGAGREIMRKARAEPGPAPVLDEHGRLVREVDGSPVLALVSPRWVATGRTVLNNKGDVIKQYEPFFSGTHEFEDEDELVEWGVTRVFHHDPMHRVIRTDYPDGTRSRKALTPWLTETWDPSDTVTEPGNAWAAARKPEAAPSRIRRWPRVWTPRLVRLGCASWIAREHATTRGSRSSWGSMCMLERRSTDEIGHASRGCAGIWAGLP